MLSLTSLKYVEGVKMDAVTIETFINTIGFPIFICLCLMWYIKGTLAKHSEIMEEIQRSLSANTESIRLLIQKLQEK